MDKHIDNFRIISNTPLTERYHLLEVKPISEIKLTDIKPGQFVQIQCQDNSGLLLRRPISIHDVDIDKNTVSFLVCNVGKGTESICHCQVDDTLNIIFPLGNGFSLSAGRNNKVLLMGGGVGVAPLYYLGKKLKEIKIEPHFLLAARSADLLLRIEDFSSIGNVDVATDDGSLGHKGLITQHPVFHNDYNMVYCCGPMPMMKAVGLECHKRGITCEVSLENTMACGIGACLCCVEKTIKGNRCVCTDGPVFNIDELTWF